MPAERHGGDRTPAEDERHQRTRRRVEQHVDESGGAWTAGDCRGARPRCTPGPSMSSSRMTPISAPISMNSSPCVIGKQPAFAEGETAEQDERDRRDAEPAASRAEQPIAEQERADLDEDERAVVHPRDQPPLMMRTSLSRPSRVPTATMESPLRSRSAGAGAGACRPHARSRRSSIACGCGPSCRRAGGRRTASRRGPGSAPCTARPTCSRRPASWVRISEPPSTSGSAVASSSLSAIVSLGAVGIVLVGDRELATAVAEVDDRQATTLVGDDVVAYADARQLGPLNVRWHASIMAPQLARSATPAAGAARGSLTTGRDDAARPAASAVHRKALA